MCLVQNVLTTTGSITSTDDAEDDEEEDGDGLIVENTIPCSLTCQLSLMRIRMPAKGKQCKHVQCFELTSYIKVMITALCLSIHVDEQKFVLVCYLCSLFESFFWRRDNRQTNDGQIGLVPFVTLQSIFVTFNWMLL